MFKKCAFYVLSAALLLGVSFTTFSNSASAVSDYDDFITEGNFNVVDTANSCDIDGANWASIILDSNNWINPDNYATIAAQLSARLDDGSGWGVSQIYSIPPTTGGGIDTVVLGSGDSALEVYISSSSTGGLSFTQNTSNKFLKFDVPVADVILYTDSSCNLKVFSSYTSLNNRVVADAGTTIQKRPVFINAPITYPEGYEGDEIPNEAETPGQVNKMQFGWSVDRDGLLTAFYNGNLVNDVISNCGVSWSLLESDSAFDSDTLLNNVSGKNKEQYRYENLPVGFYKLKLTPNYCIPFIDNGDITPTIVNIAYDGSFIGGTSEDGDNQSIFAVQSTVLNELGLSQAIQAPLNAINDIVGAPCSAVSLPFINGSNISIPCLSTYYTNVSVLYTIWQVSITGIVGYWVAVKTIAHVKGLLDPENDRIEVVNL